MAPMSLKFCQIMGAIPLFKFLFQLHLCLIFLANSQIRLKIRPSLDRGGAEFFIDGIICLIQLSGALFLFVREQGHLRCLFPCQIVQSHADKPQGSAAVPQLSKQLLAEQIDFIGNVGRVHELTLMGPGFEIIGTDGNGHTV